MPDPAEFFRDVEHLSRTHVVNHHEFLARMASQRLTLTQLQAFASQHYFYSRRFAQNLAAVISNTPDEDARTLLVLNMHEEIGEPSRIRDRVYMLLLEAGLVTGEQLGQALDWLASNPINGDVVSVLIDQGVVSRAKVGEIVERNTLKTKDLTHPALFRRFMRSIELSAERLASIEPLPATDEFNSICSQTCRTGHWLEGLGAMGPGTECIVPCIYSQILQGIVSSKLVSESDYVFWTIHVHCDDGHGQNIIDAMSPYAALSENQERIWQGTVRILDARARWFDGLYGHVFGSALEEQVPAAISGTYS
jgi:pyrroloquinoline quinone (PQQ) biosynthesis protein C